MTAILVCAVMVLVAAVPLALAETHDVTKGAKGPNASAKTWEYVPAEYGFWYGHIVNNGLRSLVVDVYDNETGVPEEIMHQRIRFAAYDVYPLGEMDSNKAPMVAGRNYEITVTPNGPRGSSCTVEDMFIPALPPVAVIEPPIIENLVVTVDGSNSYDPDGTVISYAWNWGDMTMDSTTPVATHTYAMAGTYTITLVVADNDGLTDDEKVVVEVAPGKQKPVASFTVTMDWMTASVVSTSTDADGVITAWDWNFGDGMTASGPSATHTYTAEGPYTISLTVTDNDLLTDTATKSVTARTPKPPTASFTMSLDWLTVSVVSTSTDPDGTIESWEWNFGDGGTASGATATHTYAGEGTFTITLVVKDNDGLTDDALDTLTIVDEDPIADFTYVVNGLEVSVDASTSWDDHGIVSYAWSWGDGTTGTGKTATHTYSPTNDSKVSASSRPGPPPPPFFVQGMTYDALGNMLFDCSITIENLRTGAVNYTTSVDMMGYAYYEYNLNDMSGGWVNGDIIQITATKGTLSGVAEAPIVASLGYLWIDVTLVGVGPPPPYDVTITLTVTDALGQAASVSKVVTVVPQ